MNKPKQVSKLDGHLILYSKGYYKTDNVLEGLRLIWCTICGLPADKTSKSNDIFIANTLIEVINNCSSITTEELQFKIHLRLDATITDNYTHIEAIILAYLGILSSIQIKCKYNIRYKALILLPKPKKRVFNRILKGNGRYEDYKLIT